MKKVVWVIVLFSAIIHFGCNGNSKIATNQSDLPELAIEDCACKISKGKQYGVGYISNAPIKGDANYGLITLEYPLKKTSPSNNTPHSHVNSYPTIPVHYDEVSKAFGNYTKVGDVLWKEVYFQVDCSKKPYLAVNLEKPNHNIDTISRNYFNLKQNKTSCFPIDWHHGHFETAMTGQHTVGHIIQMNARLMNNLNDSINKNVTKFAIGTDTFDISKQLIAQNKAIISIKKTYDNSFFNDIPIADLGGHDFRPTLNWVYDSSVPTLNSIVYVPTIYCNSANISKGVFLKNLKYVDSSNNVQDYEYPFLSILNLKVISSSSIYHDHGQKVYIPLH